MYRPQKDERLSWPVLSHITDEITKAQLGMAVLYVGYFGVRNALWPRFLYHTRIITMALTEKKSSVVRFWVKKDDTISYRTG